MKNLDRAGRFVRDLKRIAKRGWNQEKLETMVILLREDKALPVSARPHKLTGEWLGFWECHIAPDPRSRRCYLRRRVKCKRFLGHFLTEGDTFGLNLMAY